MSLARPNGDQQSVLRCWINGGKTFLRRLDLQITKAFFAVNDLTLKITQFDGVIVDQRQSTHAGRCEVERAGEPSPP